MGTQGWGNAPEHGQPTNAHNSKEKWLFLPQETQIVLSSLCWEWVNRPVILKWVEFSGVPLPTYNIQRISNMPIPCHYNQQPGIVTALTSTLHKQLYMFSVWHNSCCLLMPMRSLKTSIAFAMLYFLNISQFIKLFCCCTFVVIMNKDTMNILLCDF